ncbi:MAG: YigZ family protein [Lachnospiraceae bacterium]|nr:YigZ family protein [Lachnospiraceae bacterium]MDE6253187.1 YigZ family protein [Lachnospiraceae bacterium]
MILLKPEEGEYEEKKSKFIAHINSINSEQEAADYIAEIKKKYWDARHNCYAYILGSNNEIQRFSDDGEPGGTAGKPILDVLVNSGLHNVIIVVTRYFGGVLLGTGGLVRAYQKSSADAVAKSVITEKKKGVEAEVSVEYSIVGKLQYIASELGVFQLDAVYEENVKFKFLIPENVYEKFCESVMEASSANAKINKNTTIYYGINDGVPVIDNTHQ